MSTCARVGRGALPQACGGGPASSIVGAGMLGWLLRAAVLLERATACQDGRGSVQARAQQLLRSWMQAWQWGTAAGHGELAGAQHAPQLLSPSHEPTGFSLELSKGDWMSRSSSTGRMLPCCCEILIASCVPKVRRSRSKRPEET